MTPGLMLEKVEKKKKKTISIIQIFMYYFIKMV